MTQRFAILALALVAAGCAAPMPGSPAPGLAPDMAPASRRPALPQFSGMAAANLRIFAGSPAFTRKDGNVEMWRYDTGSCHAFFFLSGTPAKVGHVETLPRGKDSAADRDCLIALQEVARPDGKPLVR